KGFERAAVFHAAAKLDQLAHGGAEWNLVDTGPFDMAGQRHELEAGEPRFSLGTPPIRAAADDGWHHRQRFHIIDERRLAVETMSTRERRLVARLAPLVFQGLQQGGLFTK